jgi:excisionase family DNA binding protein
MVEGWITLKDAAAMLGYQDASTLRHAIKAGELQTEKIGTTHLIKREWLDAYLSGHKGQRGRPRGPRTPRTSEEEQ